MPEHDSVIALLRERAARHGSREALVFSPDPADAAADEPRTYAELDAVARGLGGHLAHRFDQGTRLLLPYAPGPAFAESFLACLYAGMIAVPTPMPDGYQRQRERLVAIARDAGAAGVLVDAENAEAVNLWTKDAGLELAVVVVDGAEALAAGPDAWREPATDARTLAFLQYTSGSTSLPKGVAIDHGNVLANADIFARLTSSSEETRFGGWLPMYHDFGLIGLLLTPLVLGATTVLMSPAAFLKRPHMWLHLMDRQHINVSPAPNFAFDLCVQRITDEQIAGLDLSRWTQALNGSEPVRATTLRAFAERFAGAGLRRTALQPGYGMAETTLCVSCTPATRGALITPVDAAELDANRFRPAAPGTGPGLTRDLVSSGRPTRGLDVRIVDPRSRRELPEGEVGEIWVRGENVARGYWQRPQETAGQFGVATAEGAGGFLRTGDLGVLAEGDLYVTGRIKELIIVNGRNLYPHDLEATAREVHPALRRGVTAAFPVAVPQEEIAVVQECRAGQLGVVSPAEIVAEIRHRISGEFQVAVGSVALVRPGEVRRTSSGKIQRAHTGRLFTEGALKTVHEELSDGMRATRRMAGRRG